jgi:hypothetical protein
MAARAPGLLPDPVVVKPLVMRLRTHGNGTWDMQPCRAAVGFLRQICDPCAAEPIQQCLKDWFPRVHEQTGLTLGTLGVALLADGALQAAI